MSPNSFFSLPLPFPSIFGVELFLLADGSILLNEIAPRPHNTGHFTQDACSCSQFENHLRAVTSLPLGSTKMSVPFAAMINVLGDETGSMEKTKAIIYEGMTTEGATVHWYGKGCRPGRKMGHINVTADSQKELAERMSALLLKSGIEDTPLDASSGGSIPPPQPLVSVIMGSDSDLPCMSACVSVLLHFGIPYEVDIVSAHRTPQKMVAFAAGAASRGIQCIVAGAGGAAHLPGMVASMTPLPVVGVPIKTSTLNGLDSLLR